MKTLLTLFKYVLIAFTLVVATSCEDDDTPPDLSGEVKLANNATLGEILVDGNGNTLYYFTRDVNGESACSGGVWMHSPCTIQRI